MKYTFPTLDDENGGRTYLVMGPHVWGKNREFLKAVRNARAEGRLDRYIVFNVPSDAYVDDLGNICWRNPEQTIHEVVRVGRFEGAAPASGTDTAKGG